MRGTKEILNLPDAIGLVVLLNEDIEVLSPNIAVRKVSELLCRARSDGSIGTPISFAWCLFESHLTECEDHLSTFPCVLLEGPDADTHSWFDPLFSDLLNGWAQFNNANLIHSNIEKITDLSYRSAQSEEPRDPSSLTRQEYWEQQYSANPYLRALGDNDVLTHGARVFAELTPFFLKDGPRLPIHKLEPLLTAWSDFLQESRHRGLDLKRFHTRT